MKKPEKYSIQFIFNGKKINKRNSSINEAIIQVKPDVLLTEFYIKVKKGKDNERNMRLPLRYGKKLFNNDIYREIFINNLMI